MLDLETYLTRERRQLIEANGHRKVRTIIRTDDTEIADIVFDIASGGQEHTIKGWLNIMAQLDDCTETLEDWVEARYEHS